MKNVPLSNNSKVNQMQDLPEKISIIIVTFNAADTLQNCLDSIYRQTYKNIEIVVIDGSSTDATVEILKKNNSQIAFWKSEPDKGVYDAMNKATQYISGQWVYFLGSDDILLPDFSGMANELHDPQAIYYGSVITKGLKRFGKVSTYHMAKTGIFHQAVVYPVVVFSMYKYDGKYKIFADSVLNMRCFKDKSLKWIYKEFTIANFNHTGLSATKKDHAFEKDKPQLIRENFTLIIWVRYLLRTYKRQYLYTEEF